jgi:hypothetical protein
MNISKYNDVSDCDSVSDDGFNCDEEIKDFIKELKRHIKILEKENTKLRKKCNLNSDEEISDEDLSDEDIQETNCRSHSGR